MIIDNDNNNNHDNDNNMLMKYRYIRQVSLILQHELSISRYFEAL
jgi:hypothetical protein